MANPEPHAGRGRDEREQPDGVSAAQLAERGPLIRAVPNEVCVVVESDGPIADPAAVYGQVATQLNRELTAQPWRTQAIDPLEEDLLPSGHLGDTVAQSPQLLQPLRRLAEQAAEAWVVLPSAGRDTMLCFYSVGDAKPPEATLVLQAAIVRELVNLLNWQHLPLRGQGQEAGYRIAAITPNWLTSTTHSRNSPGTRPERILPYDPTLTPPWCLPAPGPGCFRFTFLNEREKDPDKRAIQQRLNDRVDEERRLKQAGVPAEPGVIVAVLDTSPSRAVVEDAANNRYPDNLLLREVANNPSEVFLEEDWTLPGMHFDFLSGYYPNWKQYLPAVRAGRVDPNHPDHGLFVAGIIRDIAPRAQIHLIRVLGDNGLGDLLALAATLRQLPDQLLGGAPAGTRLIINLSLIAEVPSLEEWLPQAVNHPATFRGRWQDMCATMGQIQSGLAAVVDWLARQGVLVVAAAGNLALGPAGRPQPSPPAAYEAVLGVAAVNAGTLPAFYSDRGDMVVFGNGIAVFGGEGIADSADELAEIPEPDGDQMDAVAGLFSAEQLPLTPANVGTNKTGWVYWSGTSFATPVISAIAANEWLADPARRLDVPALVDRIRSYATEAEARLEADTGGPFDCSAIYATQVYRKD